ncbi:uncharacterized protein LOC126842499 [Adelges cooleyi]|uniref:uncharacterized protein LOC126842499 n=1 Tax=Adelges cooleyi TaxID=133065 RepID=UPI00217F3D6C|nr:uncharacterized protein LOC126842499 [Adelges cooleyi]
MTDRNSKDEADTLFYFYYDLAKKMALNEPSFEVLKISSSWLSALEKVGNKDIRNSYIKLLVLALQHPEPMCPFKDLPPETIDPLEDEVFEMARKFMKKEGTATCSNDYKDSANPTIETAVSHDTCTYAASQVIPNVGTQCYFATSNESIHEWSIPPQLSIPKEHMHARSLDWERTAAGIQLEAVIAMPAEPVPEATTNDDQLSETVKPELSPCRVMDVEQQNRNVTENFTWANSSFLTGEIILGAEMCSDRNIEAQIKTQSELDDDVMTAHDKLYPGDFKVQLDSSFVSELNKAKHTVTEAGDINNTNEGDHQDCKLKQYSECSKPPANECVQQTTHCGRQSAGQEIISPPKKTYKHVPLGPRKSISCCEVSEGRTCFNDSSSDDFPAMKGSKDIIDNYKRQLEKTISYQQASLEFKRSASAAEECLDGVKSLLRIPARTSKNDADFREESLKFSKNV